MYVTVPYNKVLFSILYFFNQPIGSWFWNCLRSNRRRRKHSENKLSQCNFVDHKFHFPWIDLRTNLSFALRALRGTARPCVVVMASSNARRHQTERTVPREICGSHDAYREVEPCVTLPFVLWYNCTDFSYKTLASILMTGMEILVSFWRRSLRPVSSVATRWQFSTRDVRLCGFCRY